MSKNGGFERTVSVPLTKGAIIGVCHFLIRILMKKAFEYRYRYGSSMNRDPKQYRRALCFELACQRPASYPSVAFIVAWRGGSWNIVYIFLICLSRACCIVVLQCPQACPRCLSHLLYSYCHSQAVSTAPVLLYLFLQCCASGSASYCRVRIRSCGVQQ